METSKLIHLDLTHPQYVAFQELVLLQVRRSEKYGEEDARKLEILYELRGDLARDFPLLEILWAWRGGSWVVEDVFGLVMRGGMTPEVSNAMDLVGGLLEKILNAVRLAAMEESHG